MKQLADGLYLLRGFPPNAINAYLAEDVLIDAATRQGEGRIMRQIRDRPRRLAALEPELVCFGHGPPLRDTAELRRFIATLPAD